MKYSLGLDMHFLANRFIDGDTKHAAFIRRSGHRLERGHTKYNNANDLPFFLHILVKRSMDVSLTRTHVQSHRYLFLAMMSEYKRRTCPLLQTCNDFEQRKNKFSPFHDNCPNLLP